MRRWIAILLLCLASIYLGATGLDACIEGPDDDCAPVCHILCADGCATVPVPEAPQPPSPDPPPRPCFAPEPVVDLGSLAIKPEKEPPRA